MDTMQETLERLRGLQAVLKDIYDTDELIKRLPESVRRMRRNLEPFGREIEAHSAELAEIETLQGQFAIELQESQDRLQEISKRLNSVNKTKELEAVEKEFSMANEKIAECNRRVNELRNRHESLTRRLAETKPEYQSQVEKVDEVDAEIKAQIYEAEERLVGLREERKKMIVGIEIPILNRFEKIVNSKDGIGIVQVVNDSCDGCHMRIPPQLLGKIKRGQELVMCLNCSRILYI